SWFAFTNYGILFDASYSIVGGFAAFSVPAAYQFIVADRDKRMIRTSFSHYVAPSILEQIERSNQFLALGGVNRTVTVMFCDIRNFTPLSETMSATELVGLLNELFTALGEKILKQEGTIDKFIGDAIMAFWNAPLETEHHRVRAAQAALGMRVALAGFNDNMERSNVRTAIGISSGLACVGNIGSKDRFNYSAIGDTVNVAARIETACRHVDYDILLTEDTAEGVDDLALLDSGRLELKGKSELTQSYILVGDNELKTSDDFRALKDCHDHFVKILGSGGGVDQDLLQKCRDLGQKLEPGLATFYARIEERPGDYAHLAVA
ncbi:MAG: adenylate/guanylate cyclase domain-containing protein, partial [Paracoccaceae bacterium]|nr:adenylate/guanylate cyclase domain-containing protein [Paracoccaceae bacterium]